MFFSFANIPGGQLPGPFDDGTQLELRNAMLAGFPREDSSSRDGSTVQWDVAQAWDEALARAGAARPSTISHFEKIADIYWLADKVSPFELDSPVLEEAEDCRPAQDYCGMKLRS